MSHEGGVGHIRMRAEVTCLRCGLSHREDATCSSIAARHLSKIGWAYTQHRRRWGWHCPSCAADKAATASAQLRAPVGGVRS